ncbi:flagellar hook-associated protein FlgL [Terasakiispira papahanaumokuakeensis]|nr:flagellar hook-associated protein FlgL [Terasakiispira papahanaumokuakeensis]
MRLSTAQMFYSSRDNMLSTYSKMNSTYDQLSSGKRVLTPADDPVASAQSLNTKTRQSIVEQYNRNADYADKNLDLTESVLDQTGDVLNRLKELAIQLGSDQYSDDQIKAAGVEAKELLNQLQGLVNTQNETDEYIFAGSQGDQKAYSGLSFQGDDIERELQVSDDVFTPANVTGAKAFENLKDEAGNLLEFRDDSGNLLPSNMMGAVKQLVDATGNGTNQVVDKEMIRKSIDDIDVAFDQALQARSEVGARQSTISSLKSSNEDFVSFAKKSISNLEDLDYAEAISQFKVQQMSLQASQQAFGQIQGLSLFNYV